MLVLKTVTDDKVKIFDGDKELGTLLITGIDRGKTSIAFDFERKYKIELNQARGPINDSNKLNK